MTFNENKEGGLFRPTSWNNNTRRARPRNKKWPAAWSGRKMEERTQCDASGMKPPWKGTTAGTLGIERTAACFHHATMSERHGSTPLPSTQGLPNVQAKKFFPGRITKMGFGNTRAFASNLDFRTSTGSLVLVDRVEVQFVRTGVAKAHVHQPARKHLPRVHVCRGKD